MSRFARKGTVSKGSGPIHLDSYALKGVPIRYTPPIFLPELLHLPASWKQPVLPSRESFHYDYRVEKAVLEMAKHRAVSIAAEHSLQMKEIERLRAANQLVESPDDLDDSVENSLPVQLPMPRPPIIPGDDILTPTPVVAASTTSQSSSDSNNAAQTSLARSNAAESKLNLKKKVSDGVLSLGESSLREFEGDSSDPFEIASLQAINDMEILQTVLQPKTTPPSTAVGTTPPIPASTNTTRPLPVSQTGLTRNSSSAANLSSLAQPVTSPPAVPTCQASSSGVAMVIPSLPIQVPQRAASSPSVGVASGSSPSNPFFSAPVATLATVNPFYPSPAVSSATPPQPSTNPFQATSPPATGPPPPSFGQPPGMFPPPLQTPGVGTLIDIGSSGHQQSSPTLPLQTSPSLPRHPVPPVPKPRTAPPSTISSSPTTAAVTHQQRNPIFPSVQQGRIGLGVPVLPPISGHTHSVGSPAPPPYKVKPSPPSQHREGAPPPPPYTASGSTGPPVPQERSRPSSAVIPPPVTPRAYKLPDPTSTLREEQKQELKSISGMGFPSPRVARALLKSEGDRTKVFDFLFLVGQLEEKGFGGDSAETALLACNDKLEEAEEYLGKMDSYKGMGFPEKAIHEAYSKSNKDWDKTLDILIQER